MKTIIASLSKCCSGIVLVSALFSLTSAPLHAQTTVGFSVIRVILPDTSYLGATDSAAVTIQNTTNTTYQGYANFYYTTDTSTFSPLSLCNTPGVQIAANDTFQIHCAITFDSTYWNTGNNIVVVWSSGNAIAPADSTWRNVFLLPMSPTLNVQAENQLKGLHIYPSLASDHIFVETAGGIPPAKIFIADVSGRLLSVIAPAPDQNGKVKVNVSALSRGIYFLDLLLPDKSRYVSKFVKLD